MTNLKFQIGQEVLVKNRNYTIIQIDITAEKFPNTKRNNPHIDLHIIVKGKKGTLRAGYATTNGSIILF